MSADATSRDAVLEDRITLRISRETHAALDRVAGDGTTSDVARDAIREYLDRHADELTKEGRR